MSIVEAYIHAASINRPMLNHLWQERYRQGQSDRDAGLLPRMRDTAYLEGYLKGRPEGLDETIQYFSSVEDYLLWKQRA
jgi:hypothetical protein